MKKILFYAASPVIVPTFWVSVYLSFALMELSFLMADFAQWAGVKWFHKDF